MSREQAKAFIERMKSDEAFQKKVMAIEDAEERIACIHSEGFLCTLEEINEAANNHIELAAGIRVTHLCPSDFFCNGRI
ncbi:Nif11-like leader peptide family natural product precursor [Chlorobium sp. N1]|uniref:Nif11-like leader peptide family natural product precursor n=1 Tax=Chlorobium sp. N1 TaxID=2491138 RepID=UPI00103A210A|nr:Nif11-like leader peptide family natural product precursor [Chlorobium sp. N1]TCD47030.1 Nif11-like leader peptide family natural product precursor [Chlorobium sp. N1]